jgi:hypothetical protein
MKITLNIDTDRKLSKEQQVELVENLVAYAEEIIDDLTFLDVDDDEIDSKPKPKKKAPAKKAAKPAKKEAKK